MTGRSPAQFVIHARVGHAGMLMRETSLSLKEIAQLAGYGDIFFFSRQFKAIQGVPPAVFRRQG
jgi:transcriptional regulator GlxA family with amidase domain